MNPILSTIFSHKNSRILRIRASFIAVFELFFGGARCGKFHPGALSCTPRARAFHYAWAPIAHCSIIRTLFLDCKKYCEIGEKRERLSERRIWKLRDRKKTRKPAALKAHARGDWNIWTGNGQTRKWAVRWGQARSIGGDQCVCQTVDQTLQHSG